MNERDWLTCVDPRYLLVSSDVARLVGPGCRSLGVVGPEAACDVARDITGNPWRRYWAHDGSVFTCAFAYPYREHQVGTFRNAITAEVLAWRDGALSALANHIRQTNEFERIPVLADMLEEAGGADAAFLHHLRGTETCAWCEGTGTECTRCQGNGVRASLHVADCWALRLLTWSRDARHLNEIPVPADEAVMRYHRECDAYNRGREPTNPEHVADMQRHAAETREHLRWQHGVGEHGFDAALAARAEAWPKS